MGVARKKLRQAEKKAYATTYGRYLSGSEVGPGVRRAIRDLDDVRVARANAETIRMNERIKAEVKRQADAAKPARKPRVKKVTPPPGAMTARVEG